eukprot:UN26232
MNNISRFRPFKYVKRRKLNRTLLSHFIHSSPIHYQQSNVYDYEEDMEPMKRPKEKLPYNFGIVICPQQKAYVVERFGRFNTVLQPGLNLLIPFIDHIAYAHSLKETPILMTKQHAITKDNVTIEIDGVLYIRVTDPEKAAYGVSDPIGAVSQLAQTTMRSELGKMTLDKTFEERENLNLNIVTGLNDATAAWGVVCLRYEIKDIT